MRRALWLALLVSSGAALALAVLPEADPAGELAAARKSVRTDSPLMPQVSSPVRQPATPPATSSTTSSATPPPSAGGAAVVDTSEAASGTSRRQAWSALSPSAQAAWSAPPPPPAPPPPRAAAAPPPPETPKPPPFPYQWLGSLEDGQQPAQIFLGSPQRSYAVLVGRSPDQVWRIDRVLDGQLQVTWLATGDSVSVAPR
jgi:hypothetical protein